MSNSFIKKLNFKYGSFYTGESFNVEFKKFVIKRENIVDEEINNFHEFLLSGVMDTVVINNILNNLKNYIYNYIPKYTSCFLNTHDSNMISHRDSFLFIGIDDNGKITGIPISKKIELKDLYKSLENYISDSIEKEIHNNIMTNNDIMSCLKLYIYKIDDDLLLETKINVQMNVNKLEELNKILDKLFIEINEAEKIVKMSRKEMDDLSISNLKKDDKFVKDLIKKLIDKNEVPFVFERSSTIEDFLYWVLVNFNVINYDTKYKDLFGSKIDIDVFTKDKSKLDSLGTFLHEEVKKIYNIEKKKIDDAYNIKKKYLLDLQKNFTRKMYERDLIYYNIETHIDKILPNNNLILIKIRFDHERYENILKSYPLSQHPYLGYKKDASTVITTRRSYKYNKDKLDPECINF
jgi:hypothetical protein